jgi:enamine deaminase RidA (YjgF/YER057c/UK114 family)
MLLGCAMPGVCWSQTQAALKKFDDVGNRPDCSKIPASKVAADVKYVNPETMFETQSYSESVIVPPNAHLVLISGQIPVNLQFSVIGNDLGGQVKAALDNLCRVMQDRHISKTDIVRLGVSYVHKDAADPFTIAEQLSAFFRREEMPATTMVGVSFLITNQIRVQIEATAITD